MALGYVIMGQKQTTHISEDRDDDMKVWCISVFKVVLIIIEPWKFVWSIKQKKDS